MQLPLLLETNVGFLSHHLLFCQCILWGPSSQTLCDLASYLDTNTQPRKKINVLLLETFGMMTTVKGLSVETWGIGIGNGMLNGVWKVCVCVCATVYVH